MPTLFAWLGNTDLRAVEGDVAVEAGPILSALKAREFTRIQILSDHGKSKTQRYSEWLSDRYTGDISTHEVKLSSPTCFEDIYLAATDAVGACRKKMPREPFIFHLSPGTPAMAAVWILLGKTKYQAELIESSREQGVKTVSVPFDLTAEFLPGRSQSADEALARLMQGLPPDAPEFEAIVHRCKAMQSVVAMARRLAQRVVPVLIQGESGTGKELFARAIHRASSRGDKPFVTVNCGAIPVELVDAELFGHEKGAFTGAVNARAGYFESADGGTLFLDEVGELPLASQVRLLRVLQEGEVTRVGATRPKKINVRIVAATNRVLPLEVQQGRFREDLFHRLAVGVLVLPPLREREGDISILMGVLLEQINREAVGQPGHKHKHISVKAKNIIIRHSWPGNVRELNNVLLRASIWAPGEEITAQDVRDALAVNVPSKTDAILGRPLDSGFSIQELLDDVAKDYLKRAMSQAHGNKTEAARLLGMASYQTLSNWLQKYDVET